jgi:MoxR-like ATPase
MLAKRTLTNESPESILERGDIKAVLSADELISLRQCLDSITIKQELITYVVNIVRKTREHESILVGAGPRATQALILSVRAYAAIAGRDFVTPDDVKAMVVAVLEHRIVLRPEFEIEGITITEVIEQIMQEVTVPR